MKKVLLLIAAVSIFAHSTAAERSKERVKNVIFMIGDGMGLGQVTAYMIENGFEPCSFDRAQGMALIKTYSKNNRITDSAAGGTALACGEKTNNRMVGVSPEKDTLTSMTTRAMQKGLATGVVVTSAIQHATPAAFYAHVESRNSMDEISRQLAAAQFDIIVGGGAKYFEQKVDGKELKDKLEEEGFTFVENIEELEAKSDEPHIIGTFSDGHMPSIKDGRSEEYLATATEIALEKLSKNKKGFVLMVEGSQIDWRCHEHSVEGIFEEVECFDNAVGVAMDFADENPGTLVVVTADHETGGMTMVNSEKDFTKADSGVDYKFSTKNHSAVMVPVYLYGTGANQISGVMENSDLANRIMEILKL